MLETHVAGDAYDWYANPSVQRKVNEAAEGKYFAGASEQIVDRIKRMPDEDVKAYLIRLVKNDYQVGMGILSKEEE